MFFPARGKSMRRSRQQKSRGHRTQSTGTGGGYQNDSSARLFMQHGIDINTNLGEGFGPFRIEGEDVILPFVTSANIACGAHAGDPVIMEEALEMVRYYGLSLGAHIGYPDLAGFGRREIRIPSNELRASILFQLGALTGMAKTFGFEITQVRPHGYLYRQLSNDQRIASIVAKAIAEFDQWLVLIGPASPTLLQAGERAGLRVALEAWVDRTYDNNGNLLPHTHSRAIIKNPNEILRQARNLIQKGQVIAVDGTPLPIDFQTLHMHAKIPNAAYIAEEIRKMIPYACCLTSEPFSVDQEESRFNSAFAIS